MIKYALPPMFSNPRAGLTVFILLYQFTATIVFAEDIGQVIRSTNMEQYPAGTLVSEETDIETGPTQRIAFRTVQGDVLIAGTNSKIKLVKPGFFSQLFGKVYYFFNADKEREVTVQTSTATIGIRGTKFLIDSEVGEEATEKVSLLEGELNFQSNDDEYFELYQQRELSEFEIFKQQQAKEFNAYRTQMVEEFVAYKKSIDLSQGNALEFNGKKAVQVPLGDDINAEIEAFEEFISVNQLE